MHKLKYIILPASPLTHDLETPIAFPQTLQHAQVALCFAQYDHPISAGFVEFIPIDAQNPHGPVRALCTGVSDSLGLTSRGVLDDEVFATFI